MTGPSVLFPSPVEINGMISQVNFLILIFLRLFKFMGLRKNPRMNIFTIEFLLYLWYLLKYFIVFTFNNFHKYDVIPKTILALIRKSKSPLEISDFRLIALCNIIYQFLSKVLASRIKPLLCNLIN